MYFKIGFSISKCHQSHVENERPSNRTSRYVQPAEVQTTAYIRRKKGSTKHLPSTYPTQKKKTSVVTRFPLTQVEKTLSAVDGAQMELLLSICSFMVY